MPGRARPGPARRWRPRRSASCSTGSTATCTRWPPSCGRAASGSPSRWPSACSSIVTALVRLVAGRRGRWPCWPRCSSLGLARPAAAGSRPPGCGEEEAWSDLAAVMEESIHGQDDVRTSLARPYVLRMYARRASEVLARGRRVWRRVGPGQLHRLRRDPGRHRRCWSSGGAWAFATGRIDGARLTAIWLLALAFGATVEHVSRMVPELQYALGAWQPGAAAAGGAAGAARAAGRPGRRPGRAATSPSPTGTPLDDGRAPRRPCTTSASTFRPRPLVRGDRPHRLGQVDAWPRCSPGRSTCPRGTVFLGGTDLLDLDLEGLRRWIAVVPQRTEILAGTLAENVALFDPDLLPRRPGALDELGPERLGGRAAGRDATPGSGEGGHVLSAGQEQLVAFARILVRDPHVVILDEATARMDPVTEAAVQRATERLLAGPDRHRHRAPALVGAPLRRGRRPGRRRGGRGRAAARASARFARAARASGARRPAAGAGVDGDCSTTTLDAGRAPRPSDAVAGRSRGTGRGAGGTDRSDRRAKADPPPLPAAAPGAHHARDRPAGHQRPALRPRRRRDVHRAGRCSGSTARCCPGCGPHLVDGGGRLLWPAVGHRRRRCWSPIPMPVLHRRRGSRSGGSRQMLRISLRLVHGQTGPAPGQRAHPGRGRRAGRRHRAGGACWPTTSIDQSSSVVMMVAMTLVSGSVVPALFFAGTMVVSGLAATLFGPRLERSAPAGRSPPGPRSPPRWSRRCRPPARSSSPAPPGRCWPTWPGSTRCAATGSGGRSRSRCGPGRRRRWSAGCCRSAAWALYLAGGCPPARRWSSVSTLGAARWFAWTTASLVSQLPSARVWTRRTVAMTGVAAYSAAGVRGGPVGRDGARAGDRAAARRCAGWSWPGSAPCTRTARSASATST